MKKSMLAVALALIILLPVVSANVWWDSDWNYRVGFDIEGNGLLRNDWPIEYEIDFGNELSDAGSVGSFDIDSVRVIEYDNLGNVIQEVSSGFEETSANDVGNVVFILNGTTGAAETRHFFVYFDEGSSKSAPGYSSALLYSFNGEEFDLSNSFIDLTVDTLRGEGASGIYYANRIDSGTLIFNTGVSERPVEYIEYLDSGQSYSFDLRNDATLDYDSSVKKVVKQTGSEVLWNTQTITNSTIEKYYTIYEGSPWIKIRQVYSNNGPSDVTRRSNGISALALDTQRAFGMDNLIGPSLDPYSWKSTTKISPPLGIGVVNLNEVGTINYFSQGSIPAGKIGIQLNPTVISAGGTIENEALVYFNDENNHNYLQELNYQFTTPVSEVKAPSEKYSISVDTTTDFKDYNLNEVVLVTATVTTDTHDLAAKVNATLDMGTVSPLDDVTIILYDDGAHLDGPAGDKVFSGNYIVESSGMVGNWKVNSYVYDVQEKIVASSQNDFDVQNSFNANLFVQNPSGLVNREIYSTFQVFNYRNDTVTPNANVACSYNATPVTNITDLFNGNYSVTFTAPGILGSYDLLCLVNKDNNLGQDNVLFFAEPDKTVMNLTFSPTSKSISQITQSGSESFVVSTILDNVGVGSAYDINITLTPDSSQITFNSTSETCAFLATFENCSQSFLFSVKNKTVPGEYNVTINMGWKNLDQTIDSISKVLVVNVGENPVLILTSNEFNATVEHGENISVANLTLNSIGNFEVEDIEFNCSFGEVCDNFSLTFIPNNLSQLVAGVSSNIEVFLKTPLGYSPGNYSGVIEVNSSNYATENFSVNIEIPKSSDWNINRNNCSLTVLINFTGTVCRYDLNNTGNLELNYSITPNGYNFVIFNETIFNVKKQTEKSFYVEYNTTGATQGQFNSNYNLEAVSEISTTSESFLITLDVVFGPEMMELVQNETEQASAMEIRTSIIDRSGGTIKFVSADVILPDNTVETINLTNLGSNIAFETSIWSGNFTNTFQRGEYEVLIYAEDFSGGVANVVGYGEVYAKLNITLFTGWDDYLLGETGSIYYNVKDMAQNSFVSDANISMYDSNNNIRLFEEHKTNAAGILKVIPSFSIPDDAPVGTYSLKGDAAYFDPIVSKGVSATYIDTFNVYNPLFVELNTNVIWYPNGVMTFYILTHSKGRLGTPPTEVNLTVYDPAQAIYFRADINDMQIIQQTNDAILYYYKYAMPPTTPVGNFLASINVQEGERSFYDVESFFVSAGGPFDLVLTINDTQVERNEKVLFDILMMNMGEVSQDVFLDFWISDAAGSNYSKVTGEAIFVPAHGNTTITRELFIFPNQPLELHTMTVKMDYSTILDPIVTTGTFMVLQEDDDNKTTPVDPETPASGGGGGGGGGGSDGAPITGEVVEKEKIIIVDFDPDELDIGRGDTGYVMIEVKNNMEEAVESVSMNFELEGYSNLTELKGIFNMEPRELVVFPLKIEIPANFPSGFYTGVLEMNFDSEKIRRSYNVNVFDSKDELINHRIINLKSKFETLRGAVSQAKRDGHDVDDLVVQINEISKDFDLSEDSFRDRKYFSTLELLLGIENKMEEVEYELNVIRPGITLIDTGYILIALAILVLIVLIIILKKMISKVKGKYEYYALKKKYIPKKSKMKFSLKKIKLRKPRGVKVRKVKIVKIQKPNKKKESVSKSEVKDHIKTLEEQFRYGYISKKAYLDMKKRLEKDLRRAK